MSDFKGGSGGKCTLKPPTGAPSAATANTVKLLCSYGGKILPRHPDGKLRYHGGHTRVLAIDRSTPFTQLLLKLKEMYGGGVSSSSSSSILNVRCQLPTEDLDALVSIKSDEDLAHLIEEYDQFSCSTSNSSLKIRTFLSVPRNRSSYTKQQLPGVPPQPSVSSSPSPSPPSSTTSSPRSSLSPIFSYSSAHPTPRFFRTAPPLPPYARITASNRCTHQAPVPAKVNSVGNKGAVQYSYGTSGGGGGCFYLVHDGSCHWQ